MIERESFPLTNELPQIKKHFPGEARNPQCCTALPRSNIHRDVTAYRRFSEVGNEKIAEFGWVVKGSFTTLRVGKEAFTAR